MRLAGKVRPMPYIRITVSAAALGVAALVSPASATGAQVAARPANASAIAGYVWYGQGPLNTYYVYDSADSSAGAVTVDRQAAGDYSVQFANLTGIAKSGLAQVTTFGSSADCDASVPVVLDDNLGVGVNCFSPTGAPEDTDFSLLVTHANGRVNGTFDYSYVFPFTKSGTLSTDQFNSAGKKNSVRHLGPGRYVVSLGGPKSTGTRGIVKVSLVGGAPGECQLGNWAGTANGAAVNVDCYGLAHALGDRPFNVTYATANSLMGINNQVVANAFANSKAAVYQPADQYDSTRGAKVTVVHYRTGSYEVLVAGSAGNIAKFGGDVQVSAVGSTGKHCVVESWQQQLTPAIRIGCFDSHGSDADSPFTVQWVVP